MLTKELRVLEIINSSDEITQRDIAIKADISLGKTNSLINNLIDKKFITLNKLGKKVAYSLTDEGINFLKYGLNIISEKRINLHKIKHKKIRQAVILASDEKKEFEKPVGFLQIQDTTIIDRILDILKKNEIDDIIIITGYKNEYYDALAKNRNITLVKNEKYKLTGNMASLALAKNYINDDFVVIENDIVFEEKSIVEVLNNKMRDCILIASETGYENRIFVEIKNDYIFKICNDIKMLNKVDGEMVGITKISYDVYCKMLNDYETNENPYLCYARSLLNVGENYRIGYLKIDDLTWCKIDNYFNYLQLTNLLYSKIEKRKLMVDAFIKNYIVNALSIEENSISNITTAGGMTNKNYKFRINNDSYILRIPGMATEEMINRKIEAKNAQLASSIDLNVNIIYTNENTGINISKHIEDAETLNSFTAKKEANIKLVAENLKILHNSNINMVNEFNAFNLMNYYEELAIKANGNLYEGYSKTKEYVFKLKEEFQKFNIKLVPCHNDTIPENFIKSGSKKLYLIDWEYSGLNDPMWDLATYSLESSFDEDQEEFFLNTYFSGKFQEHYRERIFLSKICQDFLWSIWTVVKDAKGDDFGTYGLDRFKRAQDNLDKVFPGWR